MAKNNEKNNDLNVTAAKYSTSQILVQRAKRIISIILIFMILFVMLAGSLYFLLLKDGTEDPDDPKNAPAAAKSYMNETTIDEDGNITLSKTIQELWDELVKSGNTITKYLSSASELARLLNAQMATEYVYTGKAEDYEKVIQNLSNGANINSKEVQGIIRLRRANGDKEATYLTYISPSEFQKKIDKYNETGNKADRSEALKYFTLEKNTNYLSDTSSGGIPGTGNFTKYNLTDEQLRKIANVCHAENGVSLKAVSAEASLMANRFELRTYGTPGDADGFVNYIRTTPWFEGNSKMDSNEASADEIRVVKDVLVNGKRTVPGYIDEHVTLGSLWIVSATNADGPISNVEDRSKYKKWETKIKQSDRVGGGTYTFYCFPSEDADPFGYTSEEDRKKIGDAYYDFDTGALMNGDGTVAETTTTTTSTEASAVIEAAVKWMTDRANTYKTNGNGCIGFVLDGYINAGVKIKKNMVSNTAAEKLPTYGFANITSQVNMNTGEGLQRGDIVVKKRTNGKSGHTGCYIGNGKIVDLHSSWKPPIQIRGYSKSYGWTYAFRYVGNGNSSATTTTTTTTTETTTTTSNESHWPSPDSKTITSNFGPRDKPTAGASGYHEGIDIGASSGTNIEAAEAGKVITVTENSAMGNYVVLDHGNGNKTRYEHMSEFSVKEGDTVARGQVIGKVGQTGIATGPHLHFSVLVNDEAVNPLNYKYDNGMGNGTGAIGSTIQGTTTTQDSSTTTTGQSAPYVAKVATFTESMITTDTNDSDEEGGGERTYSMTTQAVDYRNYVSSYTMPFNYLWAMLLVGKDKDFTFDLSDLVLGSTFDITIKDNLTTNTTVVTDYYRYKTNYKVTGVSYSITYENSTGATNTVSYGSGSYDDSDWHTRYEPKNGKYYVKTKTINTSNTLDISLTKADAWCAKYEEKVTYKHQDEHSTGSSTQKLKDSDVTKDSVSGDAEGLAAAKADNVTAAFEQTYSNCTVTGVSVASATTNYEYQTVDRSTKTENYYIRSLESNKRLAVNEYDSKNTTDVIKSVIGFQIKEGEAV